MLAEMPEPEPVPPTFGERVQHARKQRGMTQEDLGKLLGTVGRKITARAVKNIEHNRSGEGRMNDMIKLFPEHDAYWWRNEPRPATEEQVARLQASVDELRRELRDSDR